MEYGLKIVSSLNVINRLITLTFHDSDFHFIEGREEGLFLSGWRRFQISTN